ncbi:hypothetical protein PAXRUDRAFT_167724 [Paxillus rubicundulus Ve08.2h10]|uniref:GH3 middle domain-containing protein n=1 Tax=Paxillus rubicundulus Ve08.2h10 TaxID=930991 RepID=A0A0D0C1N1_9AGAM|nr:hypothetical protein PAXRUDRAFT_167724 [Paxillus rubicundulus Ve08.2h10]
MSQLPASVATLAPYSSLPPKLRTVLTEKNDRLLLRIIRANFNTQYASQASSLATFRDVVLSHGMEVDSTLLQDFRNQVALMDYESYKPFVARFNEQPCKESEVENLFAPGLPFSLALTSTTSGKAPKMFANYHHTPREVGSRPTFFDAGESNGRTAWVFCCAYRQLKDIEGASGQVVKRLPIGGISGSMVRMRSGWNIDSDESRMSMISAFPSASLTCYSTFHVPVPDQVSPWAASMIRRHQSLLKIHAVFCLACRDLDKFSTTFAPVFIDLIRHMDEEWDTFVTCIEEGTMPDLEGIDHVRAHLQVHLHADPERAAELREIGSPFSCVGWAVRVWPKLRNLSAVSSGPFATALPKVRSVLGPTVSICSPGFIATEAYIGVPYYVNDLDTFVIQTEEVVEFLDVVAEQTHENILQAWDLKVGKQYQIVVTTRNGLWRYPLGDIIEIVGFDTEDGSPVFKSAGRTSLSIRFPYMSVSDSDLVTAIQAISESEDIIKVHEFTTILDDRKLPTTVGYFIEGSLGPNSHLAPPKLFDALAAIDHNYRDAVNQSHAGLPTVRIVKAGTFMDYRRWRGEKMNLVGGQIKVPVVLLDCATQEWIVERVITEL